MKKTQFIDALRNIKNRWTSFLSILLIVALGTGGFFALSMVNNGLIYSANNTYENQNFKNYDFVSNVGVTDSELELIRSVEGVEEVEGVINLSANLNTGKEDIGVNLVSLTKEISVPLLIEGKLPEKENECAINVDVYERKGLRIGDKVNISSSSLQENPLKSKEFLVVGIVIHPDHTRSGLDWTIVLNENAFNKKALNNSYTNAFVSIERKENDNSYNSNYLKETKEIEDQLWNLLDTLNNSSKQRIIKQSEEEIQKKMDEAYELLDEAELEIDENEELLNTELAKAKRQLINARKELEEGYAKIKEGEAELAQGESQLAYAKEMYGKISKIIDSFKVDNAVSYLSKLREYVNEYKNALNSGNQDKINEVKNKLDNYLSDGYLKNVVKLVNVFTDYNADGIIESIKSGNNLSIVNGVINLTIEGLKNNKEFFDSISVEKLLTNIERLNTLLENIKKAIESDVPESIENAYKALDDFLDESDVNLAIRVVKALTGIDIEEILNQIKNSTSFSDNIFAIIGEIEYLEQSEFIKYFNKQTLIDYKNNLNNLIDDFKDKSTEFIKEEVDAFFAEQASNVIIGLIKEIYPNFDVESIKDSLIFSDNIEVLQTLLNSIADNVINKDAEFWNEVSKDAIRDKINSYIELAANYKDALVEENQEKIENLKTQIINFINNEENKEIFKLIYDLTGYDVSEFSGLIENIDLLIDFSDELVQMGVDKLMDSVPDFDSENILSSIYEVKELINDLIDEGQYFLPENYDSLVELIDTALDRENLKGMMMFAKYFYGIDIEPYINGIANGDYIEYAKALFNYYVDSLINSELLVNFTEEGAREFLDNSKMYLQAVSDAIQTGKAYLVDEALRNLDKYFSTDKAKFFIKIAENYFDSYLKYIVDKYYDSSIIDNILNSLKTAKDALNQYNSLPSQIGQGEAKIAAGRSQLEAAWKQYFDARRLLLSKENEMYSEEDNARKQISEARQLLIDKQEEALKEVESIREQIKDGDYNWIIQGRDALESFVEIKSSIKSTTSSRTIFGSLFLFVVGLVCFSTIAIMVEEEKRNVGTTKAFGFYNKEIFGKYLIFAILASVFGVLLGILISYLLSDIVLQDVNKSQMYLYGRFEPRTNLLVFLLTGLSILVLNVGATFIACSDLLKSPASLLMKGDTISSRNRKQKNKNSDKESKGTLYSRLVVRNMINEKERVFISIVIVAASVFIVGVGISIRDGFVGMYNRQVGEVYKYDFKLEYGQDIDEAEKNKIINVLDKNHTEYLDVNFNLHPYERDHDISGLFLLTTDNRIQDFIAIKDIDTKKEIILPSDGLLIQSKMDEAYGYKIGDSINLYDNSLNTYQGTIKGEFLNRNGRLVVCSKEAYEKIFNEEAKNNTFLIKLNGADKNSVTKELMAISDSYLIENADHYKERAVAGISLYNMIVYILIGIAIVMSFMILTNLANILFTRKKKELTIMRINGFSIKQTKQYLVKETVLTIALGVVIAVIVGFFFTLPIIKLMEHEDVTFVRDYDIKAWLIAVGLESLFALIIHFIVFKKVEDLNFREI